MTHEWARPEGDVVTMGITDFAVAQLGDIVFLELPMPGKMVTKDAPLGVIESVKAAVDLNSPITGEIVETNKAVTENFDLLTGEPYAGGWMVKIKVSEPAEIEQLMDAKAYDTFTQSQAH